MATSKDRVGAGAIVYKKENGQILWLLHRTDDSNSWKFPKHLSGKEESSVRAAIRKTERVAGLRAQVLEEVGRAWVSVDSGRTTRPALTLYYLLKKRKNQEEAKSATEKCEIAWFPIQAARPRLELKTEREFLSQANRLRHQLPPR